MKSAWRRGSWFLLRFRAQPLYAATKLYCFRKGCLATYTVVPVYVAMYVGHERLPHSDLLWNSYLSSPVLAIAFPSHIRRKVCTLQVYWGLDEVILTRGWSSLETATFSERIVYGQPEKNVLSGSCCKGAHCTESICTNFSCGCLHWAYPFLVRIWVTDSNLVMDDPFFVDTFVVYFESLEYLCYIDYKLYFILKLADRIFLQN